MVLDKYANKVGLCQLHTHKDTIMKLIIVRIMAGSEKMHAREHNELKTELNFKQASFSCS